MTILRDWIIEYMKLEHAGGARHIPTWWFKFNLKGETTKRIRRELMRMERAKIVKANREQNNNTKWTLIEQESGDE